jgi:aromatic-L-amino-acid decarboxylase
MARSIHHVASLGTQPVLGDVNAREFCRALREPAPEAGRELEPLLDQLFDDYIPRSFNAPAPGYLAFIPGGGVFPAALADVISNMANRYTGVWQAAPALVQLEANTLDWLRDWMGFPETTRGLFTAGGSMATFNALLCARERHLGAEIRRGVLYTSDQAHHSVLKSAKLAGIMPDRVRGLACDEQYRLPVVDLREYPDQQKAEELQDTHRKVTGPPAEGGPPQHRPFVERRGYHGPELPGQKGHASGLSTQTNAG